MEEKKRQRRGVPQALRGGPARFGPYMLEARLAVGGTAEVYLARRLSATAEPEGERVVVKRLLPHFLQDEEGRTMFEREAALHAAVHHPNVVMVFGSDTTEQGEPFLVMEYVDGVDGYRLLRRFRHDGRMVAVNVSVFIVREILSALDSVHGACDESGVPLGIIHRDVTPSNLYLSKHGDVKLGDFGIARSTSRATMRNAASTMLKGKIAYLAPEQVAGEPFDHRADLFSVASVLAEMLLGKPLFHGAGQLAVLLAIRDCRIDPLIEIKPNLPEGLFDIMQRALAREPGARFQRAAEFATALAAYDPHPAETKRMLAELVHRTQTTQSSDALAAVRESARQLRTYTTPFGFDEPDLERTAQYDASPSFVVGSDGARRGPLAFAELIELIATGEVGRGDMVEYMGRAAVAVEEIEELVRFLPARTATTNQLTGPGSPDVGWDLAKSSMLDVLLNILEGPETGVLFVESGPDGEGSTRRKELYFTRGTLHHVASTDATELLGAYLVSRGMIGREELDLALAVLPKYGGRIGDTLVALGLVNAVDLFRAIRDQGRDRVAELFTWTSGSVVFYRGQTAPHVEFPLELDLPSLILAGMSARRPGDSAMDVFHAHLAREIQRGAPKSSHISQRVKWPPLVAAVASACASPVPLREVLRRMTSSGTLSIGAVLRAVEVLLAAGLLRWSDDG